MAKEYVKLGKLLDELWLDRRRVGTQSLKNTTMSSTTIQIWAEFRGNAPASDEAIRASELALGASLPNDYAHFLREMNGGEGFVGPNACIILWRAEDLAEMNSAYEVDEYAPGLFLIGSDGGGEAIALDKRGSMDVVTVPFVGMDLGLVQTVAPNFTEFITTMFNS